MLERWHGYLIFQRIEANLNASNFDTLIANVDAIESVGKAAHQLLQKRVSIDGLFVLYECDFPENSISFNGAKNWMATLFAVDPSEVTYTIGTQTIRDRLSSFATYKYPAAGANRLRIGLFGCEDDDILCTWDQSRVECVGWLVDNIANWELVEE